MKPSAAKPNTKVKAKGKGKKVKITLTPEQIAQKKEKALQLQTQRRHKREIVKIFENAGFKRVKEAADQEIEFQGTPSDFDDVFVLENVVVLAEYTTTKDISEHLKKKKVLYTKIKNNQSAFLDFFDAKFPAFKKARSSSYDNDQCHIIILYCSLKHVEKSLKQEVDEALYFDQSTVKYFKYITDAIKRSSKYEILKFLNIHSEKFGELIHDPSQSKKVYKGYLLPHSQTSFDKGYKIVSFYVDPAFLLKSAYVLRKDGWQEDVGLYQRMVRRGKIRNIRKYLNTIGRVFINNIIVTLPNETKILNSEGDTVNPEILKHPAYVEIQIPNKFNTVGIIDGQHRIYAYHEGELYEDKIKELRKRQNLLVTGIIYPKNTAESEKRKFEAGLFREINSNQSNVERKIIQEIALLTNPFSEESVAKQVINKLNESGPLATLFERYFFDTHKLKTTSIVSYGVKPAIKFDGADSLFAVWSNPKKADLLANNDEVLLNEYIEFCTVEINKFLIACRMNIANGRWSLDKKDKTKILTTTSINGFIVCIRELVRNGKLNTTESYKDSLVELDSFNFSKYKSSAYGEMGREMYKEFFG